MSKLCFIIDYEWLCQDDDGLLIVGIIVYVQDVFGDVVFVQLLEFGEYVVGSEVVVLELVKVVSNILMLLDGEVVVINDVLLDVLELVNQDLFGEVWFFCFCLVDVGVWEKLFDQVVYDCLLNVNVDV